jgi:hypothetical protein
LHCAYRRRLPLRLSPLQQQVPLPLPADVDAAAEWLQSMGMPLATPHALRNGPAAEFADGLLLAR